MIGNIILLLLGFWALIIGANLLVDGASNIAKSLRIPNIIIGLTIVALGTSAPEAAISINGSINGNNGVLLGNIIGSNIFNLLIVLGVSGILKPFNEKNQNIKKDYWFSIFTCFILLFLTSDIILFNKTSNVLSKNDGLILILMFLVYLILIIKRAINLNKNKLEIIHQKLKFSDIFFFVSGLTLLIIGGEWVVDNASKIASNLNLQEGVIGLTIVALGTSLPELATGIVAIRKEKDEIALGNVIGSNILNILFILGISSLINPIAIPVYMFKDLMIMGMIFVIVYYLIFTKQKFKRVNGIIMIIIYIIYTIYLYV